MTIGRNIHLEQSHMLLTVYDQLPYQCARQAQAKSGRALMVIMPKPPKTLAARTFQIVHYCSAGANTR